MEDLWRPPDLESWKLLPCITGRLASEADVKKGRAVFYLQPSGSEVVAPYEISLPACAILHDEETDAEIPVFVIQAETANLSIIVGYRPLSGGNGVCTIQELEFLEQPDHRFFWHRPNGSTGNIEPA